MAERKKPMTDEERLSLAGKLDDELDNFINGFEKKRFNEGWPEDRWEEEMDKHPFFMEKLPKNNELSPLLEGLQQLKYDETLNSPNELTLSYKEDGIFNYKHKKYRIAIISFTEGLKQKCDDEQLNAQLFNNRSACHFMLGNFRSCILDCKEALKINPNYNKTQIRLAQSYMNIGKFDESLEICDILLKENPKLEIIIDLKTKAFQQKKILERNQRKESFKVKKEKTQEGLLLQEIKTRNLKLIKNDGNEVSTLLDLDGFINEKVHLVDGRLIWPVLFLYPEFGTSDYIQEFHEDIIFQYQLNTLFEETPSWDQEKKYCEKSINVYIEESGKKVNINLSLGEILKNNKCIIKNGVPAFIIVVKNSECEKNFLENYK